MRCSYEQCAYVVFLIKINVFILTAGNSDKNEIGICKYNREKKS